MTEQERKETILFIMGTRVGAVVIPPTTHPLAGSTWHRVNPKTFKVTTPTGEVWDVLAAHHPIEMAIGYLTTPNTPET